MRTRTFGDSGLETSVIGFGGWPMGTDHYGAFEEDEITAAARRAFDLGVTLFDTAAVYGWGEGEKRMGRAIKDFRQDVVLVTKGGRDWDVDEQGRRAGETRTDSSRDMLLAQVDNSLKDLQTDYIDLYLIHHPDKSRPYSEPMEALRIAQEHGKIRFGGVSNFDVPMMKESLESFPVICNQLGYHVFDRRPEAEDFPFITERGLGVMGYGSLAHGLLTGTFTENTEFADNDWRSSRQAFGQPLFEGDQFKRNLRIVDRLKEIAAGFGRSVAQLAIAWSIANPVVTVALVGCRTPAEVEENIGGDWDLPLEAARAVEEALEIP